MYAGGHESFLGPSSLFWEEHFTPWTISPTPLDFSLLKNVRMIVDKVSSVQELVFSKEKKLPQESSCLGRKGVSDSCLEGTVCKSRLSSSMRQVACAVSLFSATSLWFPAVVIWTKLYVQIHFGFWVSFILNLDLGWHWTCLEWPPFNPRAFSQLLKSTSCYLKFTSHSGFCVYLVVMSADLLRHFLLHLCLGKEIKTKHRHDPLLHWVVPKDMADMTCRMSNVIHVC